MVTPSQAFREDHPTHTTGKASVLFAKIRQFAGFDQKQGNGCKNQPDYSGHCLDES